MLKKRLIGVVTIKNGWAVQSFGYNRYLPLGKPECLVENLDRWGADEIFIQVIDRSSNNLGPDYDLLEKLAQIGIGTPLIYGGGIRSVEEGIKVIQRGADRISIDTLMYDDLSVVIGLEDILGNQALIASLPVSILKNNLEWFNYKNKTNQPIEAIAEALEKKLVSEIFLIDWKHEGMPYGFDSTIIDLFPDENVPLIVFGGISSAKQIKELLTRTNVTAVAVGNFLNYHEHAIQQFKGALNNSELRLLSYATEYSFLTNV